MHRKKRAPEIAVPGALTSSGSNYADQMATTACNAPRGNEAH